MLTEDLLQDARGIADRITALRRAIHAEPELGLETPKTLAKVRAELAGLPLEWREGPSCTGAVAILNGGKAGRSVLLRGDMDALPMTEETGLDFASTVAGRMHACGHDTHTAMLAGAARILAGARRHAAGRSALHVPAGRGGLSRRALHARRGPARSAAGRRLRAPHHAQRAARHDRQPRGHVARLGRHARDHGRRARRPCLDAARHARSRAGRVRDRHGAANDGHAAVRCRRGDGRHDHPDPGRHRAQRHPRSRHAQGHDPHPDSRAPKGGWAAIRTLAENIAQAHECDADVTVTQGFPPTVNDARAVALAEAVATALPHGEYMACRRRSWAQRTSPTCSKRCPG